MGPRGTAPAASPSTGRSSLTRTSPSSAPARRALHGERRAEHERVAVFPVHGQDPVAGRQARRVRPGGGGDGGGEEGGVLRLPVREDQQEDRDRGLRTVLVLQSWPRVPQVSLEFRLYRKK